MRIRITRNLVLAAVTILLMLATALSQRQMADPNFKATVERPAYKDKHPKVVLDEAHSNFHTADGRYKPFADLVRSDGYQVEAGTKKFSKETLTGAEVLVIANAGAPQAAGNTVPPAFTDDECAAVRDWVRGGGSLLLIADHAPFGSAAEILSKQFGVDMGKGFVFDLKNSDGGPTTLVFSQQNGLLGDHPLLRGREPSEEVKRVVSFTGQSLSVPPGATALMKLSPSAREPLTREAAQSALEKLNQASGDSVATPEAPTAGGRAQGIAMTFGKGRVVMLGEAAMFSAQVVRIQDGTEEREFKMGMNLPGNDDRQFALNVLHWLSGLLK
ncbi:MAG TPA: DUF4350 domain-containing protein [Blastocatellia bacterium]|nr:DUF4350 domain-containing protein [Blastocatellia bacterium]